MSAWYDRINGVGAMPQKLSPMQVIQLASSAMQNPQAFAKEHFPDIPADIQNDPNAILKYLQRTRSISDQQMLEVAQKYRQP